MNLNKHNLLLSFLFYLLAFEPQTVTYEMSSGTIGVKDIKGKVMIKKNGFQNWERLQGGGAIRVNSHLYIDLNAKLRLLVPSPQNLLKLVGPYFLLEVKGKRLIKVTDEMVKTFQLDLIENIEPNKKSSPQTRKHQLDFGTVFSVHGTYKQMQKIVNLESLSRRQFVLDKKNVEKDKKKKKTITIKNQSIVVRTNSNSNSLKIRNYPSRVEVYWNNPYTSTKVSFDVFMKQKEDRDFKLVGKSFTGAYAVLVDKPARYEIYVQTSDGRNRSEVFEFEVKNESETKKTELAVPIYPKDGKVFWTVENTIPVDFSWRLNSFYERLLPSNYSLIISNDERSNQEIKVHFERAMTQRRSRLNKSNQWHISTRLNLPIGNYKWKIEFIKGEYKTDLFEWQRLTISRNNSDFNEVLQMVENFLKDERSKSTRIEMQGL